MNRHPSRREDVSGLPPTWKPRLVLLEYVFHPPEPWFTLHQIVAAAQREPNLLRRCETFSKSPRRFTATLVLTDVTYEMEIDDSDRAAPKLLRIKATWP